MIKQDEDISDLSDIEIPSGRMQSTKRIFESSNDEKDGEKMVAESDENRGAPEEVNIHFDVEIKEGKLLGHIPIKSIEIIQKDVAAGAI